MIRYWPHNGGRDGVLVTFAKNTRVNEILNTDFKGIKLDKTNDVYRIKYPLLGPYVISNWSEEE